MSTEVPGEPIQLCLSDVPERWVAKIVGQACRLRHIRVESAVCHHGIGVQHSKPLSEPPSDLSHLKRVC